MTGNCHANKHAVYISGSDINTAESDMMIYILDSYARKEHLRTSLQHVLICFIVDYQK